MSYYLADTAGYLEDFASIGGLKAFSLWAAGVGGTVKRFVREGFEDEPSVLAGALDSVVATGANEEMRVALRDAAMRAQGVLILSDGQGDDEELRVAWPDKTGHDDHGRSGYHGTSDKAVASILKEGLKPDDQNRVWLTPDLKRARSYAYSADNTTPTASGTVLEIKIPASHAKNLEEVKTGGDKKVSRWVYKGHVPAKWIRVHSHIENDEWRELEAGDTIIYLVIRDGDRELRDLAKPDARIKGFAFDRTNPKAVAWAKAHAAATVTGVSQTTRERIKELVEASFEDQFDVQELADKIDGIIHDPDRAETIARTETMKAANRGQQDAWDQAVQHGLLNDDDVEQEWIVTPDDRLCLVCEALDGVRAKLGEEFDDGIDGPPAHPNCRCTVGLVGG